MAKANHKQSRFAKRHYEAIAEAMQEAKRYAINDDQHKGLIGQSLSLPSFMEGCRDRS
jgi:hypothetical protein